MTRRTLKRAFNKFDVIKKTRDPEVPGILGFTIAGKNTVEVGNRAGFVWVRLRNNTNEVIQAFNDQVSPVYGLPVVVVRDEIDRARYRVKGKDLGVYQSWNSSPYLPRHGNQHSFNPEAGGGGDVVFIYSRQFMPLAVIPNTTSGSSNVYVQPYSYYQGSQWKYAGGTGTASLLPYKPTGTSARMVLVYLDVDGNPELLPGDTFFTASITGNSAVLAYLPTLPNAEDLPLAGIRLVSGTSVVLWDNIYDLRPILVGDGFIPTGTNARHEIQDDGTPLADRPALNFVGTNFAVYNTAGTTNVSGTFVSAGGGGIPERSIPIYDDHVFKITGTVVDFTDNIAVAVTGSVAFVSASASGGGGITERALPIQDDGVFVVTGTAISFDGDLLADAIGTVGHVSILAGTFASGTHTHPLGSTAIQVYEDNTFKVTGSLISFDNRLSVNVSGTSAYIDITERDSSIILSTEQQLLVGGDVNTVLSTFSMVGMQEGTNPIIPPGTKDIHIREMGNILYEPYESTRRYKTTYTGYSGTYPGTEHIFYAYSEDGKTWTKYSDNPVIISRLGEDPYVVRTKDIYYLFCEDKSDAGENKVRRYYSTDFINWTDDGQCTGLGDAQSPLVWKEDDTWYMLYEQFPTTPNDIRLATSINGFAWTPEPTNPVISTGTALWNTGAIAPQDIKKINGLYYLTYTGVSGSTWGVGLATSSDLINWTDSGKGPIKDAATNTNVGDLILFYDIRLTFLYNRIGTEGMFRGYPMPPTLILSGDNAVISSDWHLLTSQSGNTDNLSSISGTSTGGQFLVLQPSSGHTITIKHGVGNIYLNGEADFSLSGDKSLLLFFDGTNWSDVGIGGGVSTDEKAKVSANDTIAGYLNGKLVGGSNISLTEINDSGDETLSIAYTGFSVGELLMQDGISNPPIPIETEDGTDWLYEG